MSPPESATHVKARKFILDLGFYRVPLLPVQKKKKGEKIDLQAHIFIYQYSNCLISCYVPLEGRSNCKSVEKQATLCFQTGISDARPDLALFRSTATFKENYSNLLNALRGKATLLLQVHIKKNKSKQTKIKLLNHD